MNRTRRSRNEGVPSVKNYLSSFNIKEIMTPLTLFEQEQIAQQLVQRIIANEQRVAQSQQLPQHLEEVRQTFDSKTKVNVKLPVLSQLSPRTKRKIASLPKPNDHELQEVRKLERMTKETGVSSVVSFNIKITLFIYHAFRRRCLVPRHSQVKCS